MRPTTESGRDRFATALPGLGHDFTTSPTPAVAGAATGTIAWTGSDRGEKLARALGAFSIGLGLAQLLTPRQLSRMVGLRPNTRNTTVMRILGLREIGTGIAILAYPRPRAWIATRIAGDLVDLALLGKSLVRGSKNRVKTTSAALLTLGVTALDIATTELLTEARKAPSPELAPGLRETKVRDSITVEAPVDEVYAFWRDPTNFPSFMRRIESVQDLGNGRARWQTSAPGGKSIEWETELLDDVANSRLAWRTTGHAGGRDSGVVTFTPAPGGRGTVVTVELRYAPPGGKLGAAFLKLIRKEPSQELAESLRAFKQVIETGEVLLSDATVVPGPHPARPPTPEELGQLRGRTTYPSPTGRRQATGNR